MLRRHVLLYFAYSARIAPDRMAEAAPGAEFQFIAHLPEWGLQFPIDGDGYGRYATDGLRVITSKAVVEHGSSGSSHG